MVPLFSSSPPRVDNRTDDRAGRWMCFPLPVPRDLSRRSPTLSRQGDCCGGRAVSRCLRTKTHFLIRDFEGTVMVGPPCPVQSPLFLLARRRSRWLSHSEGAAESPPRSWCRSPRQRWHGVPTEQSLQKEECTLPQIGSVASSQNAHRACGGEPHPSPLALHKGIHRRPGLLAARSTCGRD